MTKLNSRCKREPCRFLEVLSMACHLEAIKYELLLLLECFGCFRAVEENARLTIKTFITSQFKLSFIYKYKPL